MRGMKISHLNIQGISTSYNGLCDILGSHPEIDILTLSETHIVEGSCDDIDNLYHIPGYDFIKRNRLTGKGGGVAMYIKDGIKWKRRADLERENIESMWVEIIIMKSKNFLITTVYRPPNS
jgi:exonuclease III